MKGIRKRWSLSWLVSFCFIYSVLSSCCIHNKTYIKHAIVLSLFSNTFFHEVKKCAVVIGLDHLTIEECSMIVHVRQCDFFYWRLGARKEHQIIEPNVRSCLWCRLLQIETLHIPDYWILETEIKEQERALGLGFFSSKRSYNTKKT